MPWNRHGTGQTGCPQRECPSTKMPSKPTRPYRPGPIGLRNGCDPIDGTFSAVFAILKTFFSIKRKNCRNKRIGLWKKDLSINFLFLGAQTGINGLHKVSIFQGGRHLKLRKFNKKLLFFYFLRTRSLSASWRLMDSSVLWLPGVMRTLIFTDGCRELEKCQKN